MFTRNIRNWIDMLKEGELFFAKQTYADYFEDMQENTFYQLLARLSKENTIKSISKGLYYKPYSNDFNKEPSTKDIIDFLTNKGRNGCQVGGNMYSDLGISDNVSDFNYVFTNIFLIKSIRKIGDLSIFYLDVDYRNESYYNIINCLELIEHIQDFANINYENLYTFFKNFASKYSQSALFRIVSLRSYKKRVLAAVSLILKKFEINNTLNKILNKASKYEISEHVIKALEWE